MCSMAGYAVICYLLNVKDRHNGNLLIDNQGHVIHIDYGFILGISPGGNLGFENAAFKITGDMIALMGGLHSETFQTFTDMVVRGFLVARGVYKPVVSKMHMCIYLYKDICIYINTLVYIYRCTCI
jgi:phosphatidylinositol kinase/protein kinase (PI-3  family)